MARQHTHTGFPFGRKDDAEYVKAVPLNDEGNPDEISQKDKAKGVVEIAAGTALTAIGLPMLILPGPGALTIAGGAALALKGQRTYTGREATKLEQTVDEATDRLMQKAKEDASRMGDRIAQGAQDTGRRIVEEGPKAASEFVAKAPEKIADTIKSAPQAAAAVGSKVAEGASVVADKAPEVASTVAEQAPKVAKSAATGASIVAGTVASLARQGFDGFKDSRKP